MSAEAWAVILFFVCLFIAFGLGTMKDESEVVVGPAVLCLMLFVFGFYIAVSAMVYDAETHKDAAWERLQAAQAEYLEATK